MGDDQLYGLNSTSPTPPENYYAFTSTELFGSENRFSVSSAVSDAASMVPEIPRSGPEKQKVDGEENSRAIRAKIVSHPLYTKLLEAFMDCQKVGAPPEMVKLLNQICLENDPRGRSSAISTLGDDPELDEFMESYCSILEKCKSDLAKPLNEATEYLYSVETQLRHLCGGSSSSYLSDETAESYEDTMSVGETLQEQECKKKEEDHQELKDRLLNKYHGYISSLKHELCKKTKREKLPREATQLLLHWWTIHYNWPYPTEADKIALAESTGLDQKQINNWFINQRKRHWRPSQNMPFTVMDS